MNRGHAAAGLRTRRIGAIVVWLLPLVGACSPATSPPGSSPSGSAGPAPRALAALAAESDGSLLLVAGQDASGKQLHDLWRYAGGRWSPLAQPAPPLAGVLAVGASAGAVLAVGFDLRGGYIKAQPVGLLSTWLWHGATWSEQASAVQPPATLATQGLVWDQRGQRAVLLGDDVHETARRPQVWVYSDGQWNRPWQGVVSSPFGSAANLVAISPGGDVWALSTSAEDGTSARVRVSRFVDTDGFSPVVVAGAAPYDAVGSATDVGQGILVIVGHRTPNTARLATWTVDSGGWHDLGDAAATPQVAGFSLVWDPEAHAATLFGGQPVGEPGSVGAELWHWSGTRWTAVS